MEALHGKLPTDICGSTEPKEVPARSDLRHATRIRSHISQEYHKVWRARCHFLSSKHFRNPSVFRRRTDERETGTDDTDYLIAPAHFRISNSSIVGPSVASSMFRRTTRAVTAGKSFLYPVPIVVLERIVFHALPSRYCDSNF